MTTITTDQAAAVRAALLDPAWQPAAGVGHDGFDACTIAKVNLGLTGELTDGPHPCISETVRRFVIRIQDAIPGTIRRSFAYREAAALIVGTAAPVEVEEARRGLLLDWMWDRLGDQSVLAGVPSSARPAWDRMLTKRTAATAYAAAAAYADADAYAYAAAAAYAAATAYADAAATAYADAAATAYAATDAYADAAAYAAAYAAYAAADAYAAAAASPAYWERADVPRILTRLCEVTA